jgi:hypothetical protein
MKKMDLTAIFGDILEEQCCQEKIQFSKLLLKLRAPLFEQLF